jgi:hypothetical protein
MARWGRKLTLLASTPEAHKAPMMTQPCSIFKQEIPTKRVVLCVLGPAFCFFAGSWAVSLSALGSYDTAPGALVIRRLIYLLLSYAL